MYFSPSRLTWRMSALRDRSRHGKLFWRPAARPAGFGVGGPRYGEAPAALVDGTRGWTRLGQRSVKGRAQRSVIALRRHFGGKPAVNR